MSETMIGVIGGSGVYGIEGLEGARWVGVPTPWGDPSDEILTGRLGGVRMAFLPRHGRGHVLSPSTVPYRANVHALKALGVTDVIAISACGSFREEMAPGDFVIRGLLAVAIVVEIAHRAEADIECAVTEF